MSPQKKIQNNYITIQQYFSLKDITTDLIDVRSPSEFKIDHVPGAVNFPALNDYERERVGKIYKLSSFEAKKVGAALICRNVAQNLEKFWTNKPRTWNPVLYCWRGGERSKSVAYILEKIGWKVLLIQGGYKSYRKFTINHIPEFSKKLKFIVVCGLTGSGKTKFLNFLKSKNKQVLDLEKVASHRGSLLGGIPFVKQPSQKMFDSLLMNELKTFDKNKVIYVESESKKIGNVQIPDSLIENMRTSPCIWLEATDDERVRLLCNDYKHLIVNKNKLKKIMQQILKISNLSKSISYEGLDEQVNLDNFVMELLIKHYDPAYIKSMKKNFIELGDAKIVHMKNGKPLNYSDVEDVETSRSE